MHIARIKTLRGFGEPYQKEQALEYYRSLPEDIRDKIKGSREGSQLLRALLNTGL